MNILNRIISLISLGRIHLVNDEVQTLQATFLKNDTRECKRFQNYGFTSHPLEGMEVLSISRGGDSSQTLIIGIGDSQYRLKPLEKGEVALYTDEGDKIHLKRGNKIEIKTGKIEIKNSENELIGVLSEFMESVISARVLTSNGPQALLNPSKPFEQIKEKLDTFKEE